MGQKRQERGGQEHHWLALLGQLVLQALRVQLVLTASLFLMEQVFRVEVQV